MLQLHSFLLFQKLNLCLLFGGFPVDVGELLLSKLGDAGGIFLEKVIECLKLLESQLCSDSIEGCCLSVTFNGLLGIVQPGMAVAEPEVGGIESGIRFNGFFEMFNGTVENHGTVSHHAK